MSDKINSGQDAMSSINKIKEEIEEHPVAPDMGKVMKVSVDAYEQLSALKNQDPENQQFKGAMDAFNKAMNELNEPEKAIDDLNKALDQLGS